LPDGVEIRLVTDAAGVADYADVVGPAYVSLGSPEDVTRTHFSGPSALMTPHVHSAVAYLDGAPVSVAQILLSHGIAGVYWVGSLEAARGRGIAEAVTRHVTNLGFDLGAANVQLQASSMGEPIYRRMGYENLHRREFRLAEPPS
jgi:ribosomal protein S18 acetylase RimI-like enzyme